MPQQAIQRKTCNVQQARLLLCPDAPPSRNHVYCLFRRGDVEGYFLGAGRGLRIYADSISELLHRQSGDAMIADDE